MSSCIINIDDGLTNDVFIINDNYTGPKTPTVESSIHTPEIPLTMIDRTKKLLNKLLLQKTDQAITHPNMTQQTDHSLSDLSISCPVASPVTTISCTNFEDATETVEEVVDDDLVKLIAKHFVERIVLRAADLASSDTNPDSRDKLKVGFFMGEFDCILSY